MVWRFCCCDTTAVVGGQERLAQLRKAVPRSQACTQLRRASSLTRVELRGAVTVRGLGVAEVARTASGK